MITVFIVTAHLKDSADCYNCCGVFTSRIDAENTAQREIYLHKGVCSCKITEMELDLPYVGTNKQYVNAEYISPQYSPEAECGANYDESFS